LRLLLRALGLCGMLAGGAGVLGWGGVLSAARLGGVTVDRRALSAAFSLGAREAL